MYVWDEDSGDWVETDEYTTGGPSVTDLEEPPIPTGSGPGGGFTMADIGRLLSGTSSYGMAGQLLGLAGAGALLNKTLGGGGGSSFSGYQGGIPTLSAYREQLPIPTTVQNASGATVPRRPGSGGVTYFSPLQYLQPGQAPTPVNTGNAPAAPAAAPEPKMAAGGIASLGGYSDGGQLLRGPGDGVSDDIPATIGRNQPARLADGEFVVPARIVSELGNGSTVVCVAVVGFVVVSVVGVVSVITSVVGVTLVVVPVVGVVVT